MTPPAANQFDTLYESAWEAQTKFFSGAVGTHLIKWSTPVLAFGRWQTAKIATVGINPSPLEFGEKLDSTLVELEAGGQRFFHRGSRATGVPTDEELAEAKRRAEGYFILGRAYTDWFDQFDPFLCELGWTFASGDACHTDYGSPFATVEGIGKVPNKIRRRLYADGLSRWFSLLGLMPELKIIVGMGSGCDFMRSLFEFDRWEEIATDLDGKGGKSRVQKPYLLHKVVTISHRCLDLFWWRPYWGNPLTWLDDPEKRRLARKVRELVSCL